ncbi:MAG: glycosyltransferase family 1 protein [Acidobacteriaceae bacterium]|nr:glycosyltransferase family 1 protein [Acidobacteriaceae bacterium]
MTNILLTVTPTPGHVNPMLAIACHLRDRGHSILFNTADTFREQVESEGLRFIPLKGKANFDYRTFNKFLPEGAALTPGPEEMIHNLKHVFADTMLPQCDGLREIINREIVDLILTDFIFFGVFPLLLGPPSERPPVISISVSPIVLSSADVSPILGPARTMVERELNRAETAKFHASIACANDYVNRLLCGYGCQKLPGFMLDCIYTLPDLVLQLSADGLEFPRSDMPSHIKFVGPVLPPSSSGFEPPEWWDELDGPRPVVLVTQGTVANSDLNELIGPTLDALSTKDVTVVAATGKANGVATMSVPPNARVTPFVPFMEVLPKVDVFVTNGGFGAVNQALTLGVPMVVAGQTEDKAFVAARVAWTGAGINLGTSRPTPQQIRFAVDQVLHDGTYEANARRLQRNFAQYHALDHITSHVEAFLN